MGLCDEPMGKIREQSDTEYKVLMKSSGRPGLEPVTFCTSKAPVPTLLPTQPRAHSQLSLPFQDGDHFKLFSVVLAKRLVPGTPTSKYSHPQEKGSRGSSPENL